MHNLISMLQSRMPHTQKWRKVLSAHYGPAEAARVITQAQALYTKYLSQYTGEAYQDHQAELRTRILPGLAIFKALLEVTPDREEVLSQADTLFRAAFFTWRMKGIRFLNLLPDPFPIIRPTLKMMTQGSGPPGTQEIIEDSPKCFAINVYHCFIHEVLTAHNCPELTILYCNTDDWLSELIPKISWERTKTLGRGDDLCDFRWSSRK